MSKRLQEAGVDIETSFYWQQVDKEEDIYKLAYKPKDLGYGGFKDTKAFLFQQLWELFNSAGYGDNIFKWELTLDSLRCELTYMDGLNDPCGQDYESWVVVNKHLPDVAGEALLWCKENKYL